MIYKQDPEPGEAMTPESHLRAADIALTEATDLGPENPAYLAVVLTSIAHSMFILAHSEITPPPSGLELAARSGLELG